jgi:hypothetical protein
VYDNKTTVGKRKRWTTPSTIRTRRRRRREKQRERKTTHTTNKK